MQKFTGITKVEQATKAIEVESTFVTGMTEADKLNRARHAQSIWHKGEHLAPSQQIYTGEDAEESKQASKKTKIQQPLIKLEESDWAEIEQHQRETIAAEGQRESSDEGDGDDEAADEDDENGEVDDPDADLGF